MRIRTFVSSVALATALVSSSALLSQALAQKGTIMAPSTSWSVSKVNNQAGPYCTMARQFNQSTVLTIARNEQLETSFALDFQRPVFQTSAQMSVILDPGAGQQRAFDVTAVSGKAFVARMGRDDSFFKALDHTGLLRVEVSGRSYHFNMSDIGASQGRLDACIANMVMPAAGDETLLPEPASSGTVVAQGADQSYRQEINALRREIANLKTQNESLDTQIKTRSDGVAEVSSSVAQLSGKLRTLEDENVVLKKQLEEAKAAQMAAVGADNQGADAEELRAENLRLKAQIQTLSPQDDMVAELEQQIKDLQSDNQTLQVSLDKSGEGQALAGSLRAEIELLENKNANLTTEIESTRADIEKEYKAQLVMLEGENQSLKSNMDKKGIDAGLLEQLRQQIAETQNENRLLKETATQAQEVLKQELEQENAAMIAALEETKAEQELRIAELEGDVQALELGSSEEESANSAATQEELVTLKEYNESLKQQVTSMEAQRGQAQTLLKRIALLEGENTSLKEEVAQAQTSVETAGEAEKQSVILTALQEENAVLKASLQELKTANVEADGVAAGEVEKQALALVALQEENAALKTSLEEADAAKEKAAELELALLDLKTANTELQALAADDTVQTKLSAALEENAKLQGKITEKELELAELSALRQELTALQENSATTSEEKKALEAQVQKNAEQIAAFEEERSKMKKALADVVVVAEKLKQDNGLKDEELQRLRLAALEQKPVREGEVADVAAKELEIVALEKKVDALSSENAELKARKQERPVVQQVAETQPTQPKPVSSPTPKAVSAPAPAPDKKPEIEIAEAQAATQNALVPEAGTQSDLAEMRATLVSLEDQMRKLDMDGRKEEAEMLSRQYVALKSELERHEYGQAGQAPAPVQEALAENVVPVAEAQAYEDLSHLNEAQIQELMVKKQRETFDANSIAEKQPQEIEAQKIAEAPTEEIVMSKSADPFEELSVDGREVVPLQKFDDEPEVLEVVEQVRAPQERAVEEKAPAEYASAFSIQELVTRANVSTPDKVKKVKKASDAQLAAYQWNGGTIYGSAEQKPINSSAEFDGLVQEYLERTQMRCPGEFAIVPDNTVDRGGVRVDSYEVACVGADVSSGASLLFFNQGGTFTVVAHEAPTEEFATAMDYRNQILKVVTGS